MWGYILLGIVLLIAVVVLVPVSLHVSFHETLRVRLRLFGVIPITLYPSKPTTATKPVASDKKADQAASKADKPGFFSRFETILKQDGAGAVLAFCQELAAFVKDAVGKILKTLTVTRLDVDIRAAAAEAADTAILYGRLCSAVYPAQTLLERAVRVKRRRIRLVADFASQSTEMELELAVRAVPIRLAWTVLTVGLKAYPLYFQTPVETQKRKDELNG